MSYYPNKRQSGEGVNGKVIYVLAIVALIQSMHLLMILAGIVVARETEVNMPLLIGSGIN